MDESTPPLTAPSPVKDTTSSHSVTATCNRVPSDGHSLTACGKVPSDQQSPMVECHNVPSDRHSLTACSEVSSDQHSPMVECHNVPSDRHSLTACSEVSSDQHSPMVECHNVPSDRHSLTARCDEVLSDGHSPAARSDVWSQLGCPRHVLAPMVDASELPWRLLSRRYGAQLCYTPMVAAHQFITDRKLRAEILQSTPEDRPLIVQFCGNDAKNLTQAAKLAEPHCDGIDINIGCPQMVAKRGHYGAYLQNEWPLLTELVGALRAAVQVPVTCKIRIYDDIERTVAYGRMLEKAGCQLLAVHGRTVDQRGMNTGLASWDHISAVVQALRIPVIANGNIQCSTDVDHCLAVTGAAGVMTAEGNLYNPALFSGQLKAAWELAEEYLDLVRLHPVRLLYARGHVFHMCHHLLVLTENQDVRYLVGKTNHVEDLRKAVNQLRERFQDFHEGRKVWNPPLTNNNTCEMAFMYGQDQTLLMEMKLLETVRQLSGASNNFVGDSRIVNALGGGLQADSLKALLASLVKANKMECFVPLTNLGSCGPCGGNCGGCASDCCGGGCCGCGRYYRVKIG